MSKSPPRKRTRCPSKWCRCVFQAVGHQREESAIEEEDDEKTDRTERETRAPPRGDFWTSYLDDLTRTIIPAGVELRDLFFVLDPKDVAFFLFQENKILWKLLCREREQ